MGLCTTKAGSMTIFDWLLVFLLNGSVIGLGFYLARKTPSSSEWFLGARSLPWWGIGLSMFATNVDNADLVGITGNSFAEGLHIVSVYAVGSAVGGILAAFCVVPAIYRLGCFTNAEYLEARFGPATRVISALIQLQYRSSMLGLMIWSVYLLLTKLVQIEPFAAWSLIVVLVVLAGCYSAWGGLSAVVWTDAVQGMIMMVGAFVIFVAVWNAVGGWSAANAALIQAGTVDDVVLADLLHVGAYRGDGGQTSPYIVVLGWTIVGCGYWTVNHTQTMRLMGARSLWDMRMATLLGVAASLPIMMSCVCLGIFARAIPELQNVSDPDTIFPMLADDYLGWGMKGLVVAGILAAAISTFDSMGASLSAVFTRDIYARLFVPDGDDRHYVLVSRWATIAILASGFVYLPFIWRFPNMLRALVTLIPVFVTPLFTIYLLGAASRAPRCSGLIGLLVGSAYGLVALIDREFYDFNVVPDSVSGRWIAFLVSMGVTALAMGAVAVVVGGEDKQTWNTFRDSGWLNRSRMNLPAIREHPFEARVPALLNPVIWAIILLTVCVWVVFVLWW